MSARVRFKSQMEAIAAIIVRVIAGSRLRVESIVRMRGRPLMFLALMNIGASSRRRTIAGMRADSD